MLLTRRSQQRCTVAAESGPMRVRPGKEPLDRSLAVHP
jgi:hypothetical protein